MKKFVYPEAEIYQMVTESVMDNNTLVSGGEIPGVDE